MIGHAVRGCVTDVTKESGFCVVFGGNVGNESRTDVPIAPVCRASSGDKACDETSVFVRWRSVSIALAGTLVDTGCMWSMQNEVVVESQRRLRKFFGDVVQNARAEMPVFVLTLCLSLLSLACQRLRSYIRRCEGFPQFSDRTLNRRETENRSP